MTRSKYDNMFSEQEKENIVKEYVENGLSISKIRAKYNIRSKEWIQKLIGDKIRTTSEANKVAHSLYAENFKHTEESKRKISEIRLKYMKEHPENTIWRKRNEPSYPEKCFIKFLEENGYSKKYYIERERSVFPYYIDFAFVNEKVAVEIDGSQHITDKKRNENDRKKDALLNSLGWKVVRFTENLVKTDWNTIKIALDSSLENHNCNTEMFGIFKYKANPYKKVARDSDGLTHKQKESFVKQRKVIERPTANELIEMLSVNSFEYVARKYGVSSSAIRKWCKAYKIPHHISDIKNMADSSIGRTQDSQS